MDEQIPYVIPAVPTGMSTTPHEHIYRVLLGVFSGFVLFAGAFALIVLLVSSKQTPVALPIILGVMYGFYGFGSLLVLLLRIYKPGRLRWVTLVWNIIILVMMPFGTALGIYGIVVLDKTPTFPTSPY